MSRIEKQNVKTDVLTRTVFIAISLTILPILLSCERKTTGPEAIELLLNGQVEGGFFHPAYWSQYVYPFSARYEYELDWTQAEYQSSSHALMIRREGIGDPTAFACWSQEIDVETGSLTGKELHFSAAVRLQNVSGEGIYLNAFADNSAGETVASAVTQGTHTIAGWHAWTMYAVTSDPLPEDVCRLRIYLIMPGGVSGTVYFDDLSLTVEE